MAYVGWAYCQPTRCEGGVDLPVKLRHVTMADETVVKGLHGTIQGKALDCTLHSIIQNEETQ